VYPFTTPAEAAEAEIVRTKLWNDKKDETGPFDIIGDFHGCFDEFCALLEKMGYTVDRTVSAALPPLQSGGRSFWAISATGDRKTQRYCAL
jgi:protein phosphatase